MEEKKGTSFEELYDIFMSTTVTDYRLNNLFLNNKEAFFEYLKMFMIKGTFEVSQQLITSLEYIEVEENIGTIDVPILVNRMYFINNLLPLEKLIFINYLCIYWYEKQTDDTIAITSRISNKSERDMITTTNHKTKLQRINELRCENYANIRMLQNEHLEDFGWGDW